MNVVFKLWFVRVLISCLWLPSLQVALKSRVSGHRIDKHDEKADVGNSASTMKDGDKNDDRRGIIKKEEEKQHRRETLSVHVKEEQLTDSKRHPIRSNNEDDDRLKEKIKEPAKASPLRSVRRRDIEMQAGRTVNKIKVSS